MFSKLNLKYILKSSKLNSKKTQETVKTEIVGQKMDNDLNILSKQANVRQARG